MPVLLASRVNTSTAIGVGIAGLGTAAALLLLQRRTLKRVLAVNRSDELDEEEASTPSLAQESQSEPKLKSRIGNFKISKLQRLLLGIAEDLDTQVEFDWEKAAAGCAQTHGDSHVAEHAIDTNNETEWEKQVASEQKTFLTAAQILHDLRGSDTHRKLQHFYVVDRQLSQLEEQFNEIGEHVLEFPWREHRDDPISDLMKLPFMKLVEHDNDAALLPVSQGFVKHVASQPDVPELHGAPDAEDEKLLGVDAASGREALESAFRHKAREMHRHGQCVQIEAFHKLNNAYNRMRNRMTGSGWQNAYRGGSTDILAHYLLIGTDPSESRYGEAVSGLLDSLQRERLLTRLDVLRSWGEVSGTATGLGNG